MSHDNDSHEQSEHFSLILRSKTMNETTTAMDRTRAIADRLSKLHACKFEIALADASRHANADENDAFFVVLAIAERQTYGTNSKSRLEVLDALDGYRYDGEISELSARDFWELINYIGDRCAADFGTEIWSVFNRVYHLGGIVDLTLE